jgi:dihydrofolate reductase
MGKVIYEMSMSLDGFVTGANVRPEAGLGDGGERLHEWGFNSTDPRTRQIVESWASTGAIIAGRTTYDLSIPYWGADGPMGAARVPTVVVSHTIPQNVSNGNVYSFVNGVEAALEKAQELAGDKDVSMSGTNIARQYLQLGLIDEVSIHLVPMLFGSGLPLFGNLDSKHVTLDTIEVIQTAEVTHLRFRVIK